MFMRLSHLKLNYTMKQVMLASVVTHGGTTKTAQAALGELRFAHDLFQQAAKYGGRAVKFLVRR